MDLINVGAYVNGERPPTKKSLREALASDPASVLFETTSLFEADRTIRGGELAEVLADGSKLVVVGPDPETSRRWYANVELDRNSAVVVK
jgi:hypothetical protein